MTDASRLTRRSATLLLPSLALALGGCGLWDRLTDEAKKPIGGHREPVLSPVRGLQIDAVEGITLPPVETNPDWAQPHRDVTHVGGNLADFTWPAADVPARRLDSLPLASLDVATNGSQPAIEQARTVLENAYPTGTGSPPPRTLGEDTADNNAANNAYQQFLQDPFHPSLHFKSVHQVRPIWSVRIGLNYRAVGIRTTADEIAWFWIGSHSDYNKLIKSF